MNVGDRLGRYELVREIGRGGMAAVWDADLLGPRGFRRRVALKILHAHVHVDDADNLVHEARLGALITHPNVVSTLELGDADGRWFLCMERVHGSSAQALVAERPLPPAALLDLGVQIAAGLRHLHTLVVDGEPRPLIHRDIKPSNLLVDRSGVAKIADLGISGFRGQLGAAAGTAGYAPAEQIAGDPSPRSDVFALAASLFALGTRTRLLGKGTQALTRASAVENLIHRADFREPLDALVPGLADVLRACLRLDARSRPTAEQLGEQLTRLRVRAPGPGLTELVRGPSGPVSTAPTTQSKISSNLPPATVRPIGRTAELAQLKQALNLPGLVAVVGPAGSGKSLLAAVAAQQTPAEEAWWVDGAGWRSTTDALRAIAAVLGVVAPDELSATWLADVLRARGHLLLVLDDCGHVRGIARWLAELTHTAPALLVLVTSRQRVHRARAVRVGPLRPEDAASLFSSLAHDDPPREVVDALVERLDALPLALELAAARTRYLPSAKLLAALDDRFRVLRDDDRGLLGALEVSWEHLPDDARLALVQVAVFDGRFELEEAEAVVRLPGDRWVLDALAVLIDHHLLESEGGAFWMLGSVRAFAERKSAADDAHRLRHLEWLAQYGSAEALSAIDRAEGDVRFDALRRRRDTLERAFDLALTRAPRLAAPLSLALLTIAMRTGPMDWAMSLVERSLTAEHTPTTLVQVLDQGAYVCVLTGRPERARALCETGIRAALHAEAAVAGQLHRRMALLEPRGSVEYHAQLDQAESIARQTGDLLLLARVLNNRAQADQSRAIERTLEAIAHAKAHGSVEMLAVLQGNLALWKERSGNLQEAAAAYRESLRLHRACGDHRGRALTLSSYATFLEQVGDLEAAERAAERAEQAHRKLGLTGKLAGVIEHRASLACLRGRLSESEALYCEALTFTRPGSPEAAEVVGNFAQTLLALGRVDEAWRRVEPLLDLPTNTVQRVILGLTGVKVMIARGLLDRAEAEIELLRPAVARHARAVLDAWLALDEARLRHARGQDARPALDAARRSCTSIVPFSPASELGRELASVTALVG